MKKLFLILSLAVINFNVYADNRSKVMESVNKDMILNQRIKKVEGIKKVLVGEAKNLISITVTKDIKNINIKPSVAITHMNETKGKILFENESVDLVKLKDILGHKLQNIYVSWNRQEITKY